MKKTNKDESEIIQEALDDGDQVAWETKKLGAEPAFARRLSEEESESLLGTSKGTSVRLPESLIKDLKLLASRKGLGYQAYMRMVLLEHTAKERRAKKA